MIVKNRFTNDAIGEFDISSGANLSRADLSVANLSGANLNGANLSGANGIDYAIAITSILPDCGDVIGWKMFRNGAIGKLLLGG